MLNPSFFNQSTKIVAQKLLGKKIIFNQLSGIIVETEAYLGFDDPGSHIYKGITNRNKMMLEQGGTIYVYLCCGMYYMFNIVANRKGIPGAVLIRAIEPLEGVEVMQQNRGTKKNLTNGPGRWTQAFGIDKSWNGKDVFHTIIIKPYLQDFEIIKTTRIGIQEGAHLQLRYYIKDNLFISKK